MNDTQQLCNTSYPVVYIHIQNSSNKFQSYLIKRYKTCHYATTGLCALCWCCF